MARSIERAIIGTGIATRMQADAIEAGDFESLRRTLN
jgi:hypothetical protein